MEITLQRARERETVGHINHHESSVSWAGRAGRGFVRSVARLQGWCRAGLGSRAGVAQGAGALGWRGAGLGRSALASVPGVAWGAFGWGRGQVSEQREKRGAVRERESGRERREGERGVREAAMAGKPARRAHDTGLGFGGFGPLVGRLV
jgi:hypothetical protein